MKPILVVFALLGLMTQCKKSSHPLYKEVMEIHDDVMPKMGEMSKLERKLKKASRSLENAEKNQFLGAAKQLEDAGEAMMVWMSEFDAQSEDESYLLSEKARIQKVSDDMYQSIENAKSLLK